jgi:hypothetical protein
LAAGGAPFAKRESFSHQAAFETIRERYRANPVAKVALFKAPLSTEFALIGFRIIDLQHKLFFVLSCWHVPPQCHV